MQKRGNSGKKLNSLKTVDELMNAIKEINPIELPPIE